jgi:FkbM family methyltransferase
LGDGAGAPTAVTGCPLPASVEDIDTVWHTIDGAKESALGARLGRLVRAARHRTMSRGDAASFAADRLDGVAQHSRLPAHLLAERAVLEAVSREHSRALYLGDQMVLCRVLGKYLMYADAQETGITPHLAMDGYWESWITCALARTVRPGWHCLDVGANHGYYTLVMADGAGPEGRIMPIEPTPKLAELLRQTLDVNGFPHVEVLQKAASDGDGKTLQLVIPAHRSLNAHLVESVAPTEDSVAVESVTIDAITRDWPRVDLIKIDVEGAEESVWRGMEQTISRNREVIVVLELNVDRYEDPRRFLGTIESAGFVLRYIHIDAEVKDVTIDELLRQQVGQDWMLYLARG